jgi:hypothetical protein
MTLEEILNNWGADSQIDMARLDDHSIETPRLHHKYYKIYSHERMQSRALEAELKRLRFDKREFYAMGPTEETQKKGWKLPACGKVLTKDVDMYVDNDRDVIEMSLRVGLQQEKLAALESILKAIMSRNFGIRDAIAWKQFISGVG